MRIIVDIFLILGSFFAFAGTVGMIRMPDTFCRMQSSTNIATLGTLGTVIGGAIYSFYRGSISIGVRAILIVFFILLTNPIATHSICKAAYRFGIRPSKNFVCDEYGRDILNDK
ncbi:monovalent cation/H(+) antiporter subunit G [Caloramator sp. E03]|uniref:monovalent cation/H(+) antiporter subunit G n=1 Tax=Caloramator sp. E03 TaxID=2576307 RepID=UPI00110FFD93|nr:monovalent cation/H(+) antiporter subunit G [Caloramator sp. E03]QCX32603.1 monovalent cation/H(+) antiporter subunit G [Caloramator sp. E03]